MKVCTEKIHRNIQNSSYVRLNELEVRAGVAMHPFSTLI